MKPNSIKCENLLICWFYTLFLIKLNYFMVNLHWEQNPWCKIEKKRPLKSRILQNLERWPNGDSLFCYSQLSRSYVYSDIVRVSTYTCLVLCRAILSQYSSLSRILGFSSVSLHGHYLSESQQIFFLIVSFFTRLHSLSFFYMIAPHPVIWPWMLYWFIHSLRLHWSTDLYRIRDGP